MRDVIVIGGGIIGSSIAWQLAKRHLDVLVVEMKDTASGSAGATDGVVGYHTKKPGIQLDLAVQSIEMFRTLGEELGEDVEYGLEAGGMQPVEDKYQWDLLSAMAEEQRKSGVDIRMITAEEACELEPNLNPDIYGALYSPTGGKVNPLAGGRIFLRHRSKGDPDRWRQGLRSQDLLERKRRGDPPRAVYRERGRSPGGTGRRAGRAGYAH